MRRFLAVLLLAVAASSASAQAEGAACGLTASEVPDVRGLRLGLTTRHVFELFPGSGEDKNILDALAAAPKKFGVASVNIPPAAFAANPAYAGVSSVSVKFVDGRVASFTVNTNDPEWKHVDDFVAEFVEGTGLPPADAWTPYTGLDTQLKALACKDFTLSLFAGGKNLKLNYVMLTDTEAERLWRERREKARQAAKEAQP